MPKFNTAAEARAAWGKYAPLLAERGLTMAGGRTFVSEDVLRSDRLAAQAFRGMAMDAQSSLQTDPNSAIPSLFTTFVDPEVIEIIFAPNKAATIMGEERKGDWLMDTAAFPVVEQTGETSSYGDYNNNGRAGANANWPFFQNYIWQSIIQYGDRETERMGAARIGWVSELQKATATVHAKQANLIYLYGVAGLQNYGIVNNPYLSAPITPAPKANGGVTWFIAGSTAPNASANEVYNDILSIFQTLVTQNAGNVDADSVMTLALSPQAATALQFTNSFNVNVKTLLKENFPNMRVVTVPQYGPLTASDPQGNAGGNLVQLWAERIEGQKVGYAAFSEKMRSHRLIPRLSSFAQKTTGGAWGAIIRMPVGGAQMLGV